jgi:alpha-D-xyloside xylohydrolase
VETALANGYVGRQPDPAKGHWMGYTLDFTNPQAVAWYRSLLEPLLRMGAAAFKTDFGEEVDEGAGYAGMDGRRLHNLYALLYQQVAWETSAALRGPEQAVIWARSAWAGGQRYPLHWAGDATATYHSMAGTLCGGLHFGASGFAFWSHDVGGIIGIPDPLASRPRDDLYLRWAQLGVFSSHIRFHGGTPREPWAFPSVAPIVRQWLRFRYALLPYILSTAADCCRNGLPVLRALFLVYPQDPSAWSIADQFLFGNDFLVCPVLDGSSRRSAYLPPGEWVDFWSGEKYSGPWLLPEQEWPLERLPLFVRAGSAVEFAEPVQHTGLLPQARRFVIKFNEHYSGFAGSELARYIQL